MSFDSNSELNYGDNRLRRNCSTFVLYIRSKSKSGSL